MSLARLAYAALPGLVAVCACNTAPDPKSGFEIPDTTVMAIDSQGELTEAEWSCLGTPAVDVSTTVEVSLSGVVFELGSRDTVADIAVSGFPGGDWQSSFDSDVSDERGAYALTVPVGTGRLGVQVSGEERLTGFQLGVTLEPDSAEQTLDLDSLLLEDAIGLSAFLGVVRSPGRGVVLGGLRDCLDRDVTGAIITVSETPGEPDHSDGVSTYYFGEGGGPVIPNEQPYTDPSGLFLVVELPPAENTNSLQAWGFMSDADLQSGNLTLLAEEAIPMVADSAVSIALKPLRTQ